MTPDPNANGGDKLFVSTNDQGNTGAGGAKEADSMVGITINAVNDAPVNTVPGSQTVASMAALTFSGANAIAVSDVDGGTVRVTLTATNGVLVLSGTSGLTFTVGTGSGDTTMTFTGTITDIDKALAGMTYYSNKFYTGSRVGGDLDQRPGQRRRQRAHGRRHRQYHGDMKNPDFAGKGECKRLPGRAAGVMERDAKSRHVMPVPTLPGTRNFGDTPPFGACNLLASMAF